jgi:glycerophosphoryl diester phosphodiesterase
VIGHRGAAALAPENTVAGFQAAVAAGADVVEFDVDRGLLVRHPGKASAQDLTLDAALAYLAGTQVGLHLDLKIVGAEAEIAGLLERHGVDHRVVVSTASVRSLRQLAYVSPEITRAISYPRDRTGAGALPWPRASVRLAREAVRPVLLVRMPRLIASAQAAAVSLHHGLVSSDVVAAIHRNRASLIAWTVNDPVRIMQLAALNVDAIVTDDPGMAVRVLATLNPS